MRVGEGTVQACDKQSRHIQLGCQLSWSGVLFFSLCRHLLFLFIFDFLPRHSLRLLQDGYVPPARTEMAAVESAAPSEEDRAPEGEKAVSWKS